MFPGHPVASFQHSVDDHSLDSQIKLLRTDRVGGEWNILGAQYSVQSYGIELKALKALKPETHKDNSWISQLFLSAFVISNRSFRLVIVLKVGVT